MNFEHLLKPLTSPAATPSALSRRRPTIEGRGLTGGGGQTAPDGRSIPYRRRPRCSLARRQTSPPPRRRSRSLPPARYGGSGFL